MEMLGKCVDMRDDTMVDVGTLKNHHKNRLSYKIMTQRNWWGYDRLERIEWASRRKF
jgi:hypothetical protein